MTCTNGANELVMASFWLPEKIADGIISPKNSTIVTERVTAIKGDTTLSRNNGKASFAIALMSSNVTNYLRKWLVSAVANEIITFCASKG